MKTPEQIKTRIEELKKHWETSVEECRNVMDDPDSTALDIQVFYKKSEVFWSQLKALWWVLE